MIVVGGRGRSVGRATGASTSGTTRSASATPFGATGTHLLAGEGAVAVLVERLEGPRRVLHLVGRELAVTVLVERGHERRDRRRGRRGRTVGPATATTRRRGRRGRGRRRRCVGRLVGVGPILVVSVSRAATSRSAIFRAAPFRAAATASLGSGRAHLLVGESAVVVLVQRLQRLRGRRDLLGRELAVVILVERGHERRHGRRRGWGRGRTSASAASSSSGRTARTSVLIVIIGRGRGVAGARPSFVVIGERPLHGTAVLARVGVIGGRGVGRPEGRGGERGPDRHRAGPGQAQSQRHPGAEDSRPADQ